MIWDQIFSVASAAAMVGWAVLILAPRRIVLLGVAVRHAISPPTGSQQGGSGTHGIWKPPYRHSRALTTAQPQ